MKRLLFAMLIASVPLAISCGGSSQSVQNANQSVGVKAPTQARITITYNAATPPEVTIDMPDDGLKIKKNSDTIKWKLKYAGPNSPNAADVTLDNFHDNGNKNPFGNGSSGQNEFKFQLSHNDPEKDQDTLPASTAGVFRFRITVKLPDNGPVVVVDPVVIIDN